MKPSAHTPCARWIANGCILGVLALSCRGGDPPARNAPARNSNHAASRASGAPMCSAAASIKLRTGLHAQGNRLLDDNEQPVFLHGVGRQGTEYRCSKYGGIFDGPHDQASIDAMLKWNINAVRISLNEDCWLGINGLEPADSGTAYVSTIADFVSLLEQNGITPILDLQLAAPGAIRANYPRLPMPDRDHSPAFWASVAARFGRDRAVIFDLYNQPFPDNDQDSEAAWLCWRDGGQCPGVDYVAAGMQELVDGVRKAGSENLLLVSGIRYGNVLTRWLEYRPTDPRNNLAAAWHLYDVSFCRDSACWDSTVAPVMKQVPLIATELGEFDCKDWFITRALAFLEANGGSYIANAWNAGPGWPCGSDDAKAGPSLIADFDGRPTTYGASYREHLLGLPHRW